MWGVSVSAINASWSIKHYLIQEKNNLIGINMKFCECANAKVNVIHVTWGYGAVVRAIFSVTTAYTSDLCFEYLEAHVSFSYDQ